MNRTFGCWVDLPSAAVAELLAGAGFDWLLLDMEHGPLGIETVLHALMALKGTGCAGWVRVGENSEAAIKQVLDAGADAVMVPNVRSVAEAQAALRAFHYAPRGARGVAHRVIRAANWGRDAEAHAADWPGHRQLILQIETPEGLAAAEEIAALDGVDMLFLGPADYAAAAGLAPEAEAVREAASTLARIARDAGKRAGSVLFGAADVHDLAARGMTDISIAGDVGLLTAASDTVMADAREARDA